MHKTSGERFGGLLLSSQHVEVLGELWGQGIQDMEPSLTGVTWSLRI